MSTHGQLFLEIGCEEVPAREVLSAVHALRDGLLGRMDALSLDHGEAQVFATPRRLCVVIDGVALRQPDVTKEVSGPPVSVAFKDGAPTKAAEGFARGLGLTVADLVRRQTPKGEYLFAVVEEKGRAAVQILPDLIGEAIGAIPFRRTMRWGEESLAFIRPIQWIVALLEGEVIRFKYADVESGRSSRGHRFMSPEPFEVRDRAQYLEELASRFVIAEVARRREMIASEAARLAQEIGGTVRPDADLIDEITQLVEYPIAMLGRFDERFLGIPSQVLISEMREHQRYLSVVDGQGKLLPSFVVIGNTKVADPTVVMNGYRRVLTARFEDGAFFFGEDQKLPLFDRVERLREVQFHRDLGSTYEKVERVARLSMRAAALLGAQLPRQGADQAPSDLRAFATEPPPEDSGRRWFWALARAAFLAKADLTTSMVFEFPELQGEMGREYALRQAEPEEVASAIFEHYLPRHAGDALPKGEIGAVLGIADRLDSIAGIFTVGKGPSGTADPFGLRRAALGIIHVLRERDWHVDLGRLIDQALEGVEGKRKKKERDQVRAEVREFFRSRIRGVLQDRDGLPADVVEAALSSGFDDLVDAGARARALHELRQGPEFEPLAVAFKRVANILKDQTPTELDPAALREEAERQLLGSAERIEEEVGRAVAQRDFAAAFRAVAELRPPVDQFFAGVMVMDQDPSLRRARIALLGRVQRVFAPLADFTKLSG